MCSCDVGIFGDISILTSLFTADVDGAPGLRKARRTGGTDDHYDVDYYFDIYQSLIDPHAHVVCDGVNQAKGAQRFENIRSISRIHDVKQTHSFDRCIASTMTPTSPRDTDIANVQLHHDHRGWRENMGRGNPQLCVI